MLDPKAPDMVPGGRMLEATFMSIDKGYPQFHCARVRRPFSYASPSSRGMWDEVFKVNRRFERYELLSMFGPKKLQLLINGGFLELYPKT